MKPPKAIPPFGGLASLISFLGQIGFAREVQPHLPLGKHTPPVTATLDWLKGAPPKLIPPADRLAIGGGMI